MTVKEIVDKMHSPSKQDIALITKAFEFAKQAHVGHTRYSGDRSANYSECAKYRFKSRL